MGRKADTMYCDSPFIKKNESGKARVVKPSEVKEVTSPEGSEKEEKNG